MKRIHVNAFLIKYNKKHGTNLPVCRVQIGKATYYCDEVVINGPSRMVYKPDKPLSCGAKVWIETISDVELINPVPYSDIRKQMESI